jgi:hypothetical protein
MFDAFKGRKRKRQKQRTSTAHKRSNVVAVPAHIPRNKVVKVLIGFYFFLKKLKKMMMSFDFLFVVVC